MEELVAGVMQELREVRKELADLRARQDSTEEQPHVAPTSAASVITAESEAAAGSCGLLSDHNPVMLLPPIPSSELPDIDIVPASVKRDIVRGKDVNLAVLLLPLKDRKSYTADKDVQFGSEIFTIKAKGDSRLTRDLTITEFISAFNVYKQIMCAEYPNRRAELDKYMSFIIEINEKFPGFAFYHYHLQFSAKAAQYCEYGKRVDWAVPDSTMLSTIVAGQKANACHLCQALDHTAPFCGLNADKPHHSKPSPAAQNVTVEKSPAVCRFFQMDRGCAKRICTYRHACAKCFSPNHGANSPACRKGPKQ